MEIDGPTILSPTSVTVSINGYTLITSGTVHMQADKVFCLKMEDLAFDIVFKSDLEHPSVRFDSEIKEDKMILYLINHNAQLGEGIFEPIEIAAFDKTRVGLTYYVSAITPVKRIFQYALYRKEL